MRSPSRKAAQAQEATLFGAVLAAITIFSFWPALNNGFIGIDDPLLVTNNPAVKAGLTWKGLWWATTTLYASHWHPLTWLSHMLDVQLFGMNPAGHHLTSVLLHAGNVVGLFLVLRAITGALWRSAFAAALFGLHPTRVESVAWIAERKDVLSGLFWILTMAFYLHYARRPGRARYALLLVSFGLGLLCKTTLVALPLTLLLLDFWPLARVSAASGRGRVVMRMVIEKIPLAALALGTALATARAQAQGGMLRSVAMYPVSIRLGNAFLSYGKYLRKTVWPIDLAFPYAHPGIRLPWGPVLISALVLLVLSVLVLLLYKRRPALTVGWFWFLGTMLPVIGLVQLADQAMADRFTYLPHIGLFIAAAWGGAEILAGVPGTGFWTRRRRRLAAVAGALLLLGILTGLTRRQTGYWRDELTLYGHAVATLPGDSLAHYNYAVVLTESDRLTEARDHYLEAIKIKPGFVNALCNLGDIYYQLGQYEEAMRVLNQALEIDPNQALVHTNLKVVYLALGRTQEAFIHHQEALRLRGIGRR